MADQETVIEKTNEEKIEEVIRGVLSKIQDEEEVKKEETNNHNDDFKIRYAKGLANYSEKSYQEEKERKNLLMSQAGNLIIAISVMTAFLGGVLPIVLEVASGIIKPSVVILCSIIVVIPLFAAFVLSILILWRSKYRSLPLGDKYRSHMNDNIENYAETDAQFYYDLYDGYATAHASISRNNNLRAGLAKGAHIAIFASLLIIIVFALVLLCQIM